MNGQLRWLLRTFNSVAHLVYVQDNTASGAICGEAPVANNWINPEPGGKFSKCAACQQADDGDDEITIPGPDFSRIVVRPARNN